MDNNSIQAVESTGKFEFYDEVQTASELLTEFNKKYKINLRKEIMDDNRR